MFLGLNKRPFAAHLAITFSLLGCDYVQPEWQSQLGVTGPCIPSTEYHNTLREYVREKIEGFKSSVGPRSAEEKFKSLEELFKAASDEVIDCAIYEQSYSKSNSEEVDWQKEAMLYSNLKIVPITFGVLKKSWDDSDVQLLLEGLEGRDFLEDMSWIPSDPCAKPCRDET